MNVLKTGERDRMFEPVGWDALLDRRRVGKASTGGGGGGGLDPLGTVASRSREVEALDEEAGETKSKLVGREGW